VADNKLSYARRKRISSKNDVVDDAAVYADELNQNSEYKVTAGKKKQVEQHHGWKKRNNKDI